MCILGRALRNVISYFVTGQDFNMENYPHCKLQQWSTPNTGLHHDAIIQHLVISFFPARSAQIIYKDILNNILGKKECPHTVHKPLCGEVTRLHVLVQERSLSPTLD